MRISLRNLPKKGFNEPELKEFGKLIMLEWMSTLDKKTKKEASKQKLISQVKILLDQAKVDPATGVKLSSGLGFI